MAEKRTLGGERLGSGQKMKFHLPNFERSTHDIGKIWKSSMTVGTLVPTFTEIGLNGDTFSFDTESLIRTIPTTAPLLGSFKFQLDFFQIPLRLYNGLTHSNAVNIGLDMSKVKFPKMRLSTRCDNPDRYAQNVNSSQISTSSLHNYLGLKGVGMFNFDNSVDATQVEKVCQAIPQLGYYDIYKNYYANKQEKVGKIVSVKVTSREPNLIKAYTLSEDAVEFANPVEGTPTGITVPSGYAFYRFSEPQYHGDVETNRTLTATTTDPIQLQFDSRIDIDSIALYWRPDLSLGNYTEISSLKYEVFIQDETNFVSIYAVDTEIEGLNVNAISYKKTISETGSPEIITFPLDNIDKMKFEILKDVGIGNEFMMNDIDLEPYNTLHQNTAYGYLKSKYPLVGLALKTYQSDIFNNLMNTATINQVKQATNVAVTNNSFSLDSLFLANKTMKMLTAIAVAGGSYQDWQAAVYGEAPKTFEIPTYCGSMSCKIGFEEVVSTAASKNAAGDQPLGTLAGKGKVYDKKGGNIEIHVNEPCFIMGIASITPYVDYGQGNKFFFLDDFSSYDDLHKPGMDGVSYQDVPTETMAWWSRMKLTENGDYVNFSAGKTPAWMYYMTNYDETHGDFAAGESLGLMVLNRNYELNRNFNTLYPRSATPVSDLTTYIDPVKFNYAFADGKITAQNFWVQLAINCTLRRKISAKVIPTM